MHIWLLCLSLALICCAASVKSQSSCAQDSHCVSKKCCRTFTCAATGDGCPCQNDIDCKFGEQCSYTRGVCYKRDLPSFTVQPYTFNIPTWKPFTYKRFTYNPDLDNYCIWDSDCTGYDETCEDNQCVYTERDTGGGFNWTGTRIVGIVSFVVVATIVSCLYHMCKRARKPPNLALRDPFAPPFAPPVAVAPVGGNEHGMQPGSVAPSNSTVVEIEDDTPLPHGAPPPYNSLEFERSQNGNDNLPEQPPPSYDDAIRNSAMP